MIENLDRQLAALDPEPGRCWRTDGDKWDLMAGQKYFEGDMHRGLSGSRKPVEILLGGGKRSPYALRIKAGQGIVDILKSQSGPTVCVLSAI
ncbi:growth-regulating factor 1-like [Diospyros lotus]|uniref:growth-regulating factor 1-like n=1 Tax=Diospyros lotus TaxID=55363 RepID=UPI002256FDB5|nr:growth-regulating factor 1-like [Diospyros lotus]